MAGPTNTGKISDLEKISATLTEQVNTLKERVDQLDDRLFEGVKADHELDKRLTIGLREAERLEKKLDELLSRRWELWKLLLAALLGSALTVGSGFVTRWIDRIVQSTPRQAGGALTTPDSRK